MKTRRVQLGDVCEINPRLPRHFASDEFCSFVPMEAVDDWSARIVFRMRRPAEEVAKGHTAFAENDVLLAKITPCMENGKCAIARGLHSGFGFGTTEFHVLRAGDSVLPEWLYYYWRLPQTRKRAATAMTGSAGQKRVPASFLESLQIPLPPLPEQRRIAALLTQADQLRRTRRYTLELSDTFLPAAFLEIFGDPGSNPRGFERVRVGQLFPPDREGVKCGPFGSALKSHEYTASGVPVWNMNNVGANQFQEDGCLFITEEKFRQLSGYNVLDGDILISRAGTVGRMAIVETKYPRSIIHTNIIRLSLSPARVLPIYFVVLMTWLADRISRLKRGREDAYTFMGTGTLAELRIPVPPLALQQLFAELVREHERLQAAQRESLRQAEHLFQSLLHRAFAEAA